MPTYQYACTECGHAFDQVQSFADDALTSCPECTGRLRKVFNAVGVVFKGSGFYRNDSRGKDTSSESSESSGSTSSSTSSDTKTETKTESKSDPKTGSTSGTKTESTNGSSATKTPAASGSTSSS